VVLLLDNDCGGTSPPAVLINGCFIAARSDIIHDCALLLPSALALK